MPGTWDARVDVVFFNTNEFYILLLSTAIAPVDFGTH